MIISHSVHTGSGITETDEEYVYFVFDELRDFCLARYLLMFDESNSDNNYTAFFTQANLLFKRRLSPIEGIIKYAYHHFRETNQNDLCKKLLSAFGEVDVPSTHDFRSPVYHHNRTFSNFGLSLIFAEGDAIVPFEIEYIVHCIDKHCALYWDIIYYLLRNEYTGHKPDITLAIKIFACWENDETPNRILEYFFADRFDKYFPYHNEPRHVDTLEDWVNHIESKNGRLSESLKALLVILAAYDPTECKLRDYHAFVLDEAIYTSLIGQIKCKELLISIQELKEQTASLEAEGLDLLQILMQDNMEENDE